MVSVQKEWKCITTNREEDFAENACRLNRMKEKGKLLLIQLMLSSAEEK
jgi:hypothetical protein